jgi:hypothetical protein
MTTDLQTAPKTNGVSARDGAKPEDKKPLVRRVLGRIGAVRDACLGRPDAELLRPRDCDFSMGGVRPEEQALLRSLVQESSQYPGPIVEIGTLIGHTTISICLAKRPEQRVITVDNYCWNPWNISHKAHAELTRHALRYLVETGQVQQLFLSKDDFYRDYSSYANEPPALVFLDADHGYEATRNDIVWAKQVGARIISGHDYGPEFEGVVRAVDEHGGPARLGGSVWVLSPEAGA